jgi:hypothetical protein
MNERIKELASCNDRIQTFFETGPVQRAAIEEFAELIVQECIDKIETHQIPVGNSAAGEMACEWTYDALKQVRDEIKDHFGVTK